MRPLEQEARQALKLLAMPEHGDLTLPKDHQWDCLGSIVIAAVHSIQGTGDSGANRTFGLLFDGNSLPVVTDPTCSAIELNTYIDAAKSHLEWGHIWELLLASRAPYESSSSSSRVFGNGGSHNKKFEDFCKYFGLSKQWTGRRNPELRIAKIEASCQVMQLLHTMKIQTRNELVESDFDRRLRVFGLGRNFCEQLRRLCGDPTALKIDGRIKSFINRFAEEALPTEFKELARREDFVRQLVEDMAAIRGVTVAEMDHAIYRIRGNNL